MNTRWFILVVFFMLMDPVQAAILKGLIYDIDLSLSENVIVSINSTPKKRFVARNGSYSVELDPGTYEVSAIKLNKKRIESSIEEIITMGKANSSYDLILIPVITEEEEFLTEIDRLDITANSRSNYILMALSVSFALILIVAVAFYIIRYKKPQEAKPLNEETKQERDTSLESIIKIIRKQEGRTTQKAIRKQTHLSEAKVSLMIAELEEQNKIKKIKKGRGNIIILK